MLKLAQSLSRIHFVLLMIWTLLGSATGVKAHDLDNFVDCISIIENLVDIPQNVATRRNSQTSLGEHFYTSLTTGLGGSPNFRKWTARGISELATESGAKAILRLGLIDSFLPIYLLADETKKICEQKGCHIGAYLARPGYVTYLEAPKSIQRIEEPIFVDKKSFVRLSNFWPPPDPRSNLGDSEGAQGPAFAYLMPSEKSRVVIVFGQKLQLEVYRTIATSTCSNEYLVDGKECSALAKLYLDQFEGKAYFDEDVFANKAGISTYDVGTRPASQPDFDSNYCK
jgi:hypothetical protein